MFAHLVLISSLLVAPVSAKSLQDDLPSFLESSKEYPVTKVINLLKDMKAQLEKEAEEDEEIYDKLACWCETIEKKKAEKITKDKAELKDLGGQIKEFMAQVSENTAKINELIQDSKANLEDQKELTEMRDKEHAAFFGGKHGNASG